MDSSELAREWSRSQNAILSFIGSLVHDFAEAEELLQETAAQVFEHVHRYDSSRPFLPYAFGVARNVVLLHQRKRGHHRVIFDQEAIEILAVAFADLEAEQPREFERKALVNCYKKLPAQSKKLCRLRYEEDLSPGEIARRMGAVPGSIRSSLSRIRDQLKICIEQQLLKRGGRDE